MTIDYKFSADYGQHDTNYVQSLLRQMSAEAYLGSLEYHCARKEIHALVKWSVTPDQTLHVVRKDSANQQWKDELMAYYGLPYGGCAE